MRPALRTPPLLSTSPGSLTVSTTLLPAAGRPGTDRDSRLADATALDAVHDHVLRQLGDTEAAAAVMTDVVLRLSDRQREGATPPTHRDLLREARARMVTEERTAPPPRLVERLAGGAGDTASMVLVEAMTATDRAGAALLDLTARHGLQLNVAAGLLGLDPRVAAATRTEALRQVRAHVADAGLGMDVTAVLARLPVVPAASVLHDRLGAVPGSPGRSVPSAVAWLGTAVVGLATVGALAVALPRLTDETTGDAPVVSAERVTDSPAVRQLATPGDDVPEGGVEELVVQIPERAGTSDEQAPQEQAPEPEPSPEPSPEPAPETSPEDEAPPPEEPGDPGPSPEPEGPLGIDLLDP